MHRSAVWVLILAGLVGGCMSDHSHYQRVLLAPQAATGEVDAFGDPLPDGAAVRLGSERFGHGNYVRHIAYSPDGKMIASWGGDFRCRFWDASSGRLMWSTPSPYRMPVFSPDGRHVAMSYGTHVSLVSLETGREVRSFCKHDREITWIGFVRGGRRLVSVSNDRTIRVWHVGLGWQLRKIKLGRVWGQSLSSAAMSDDGKLLALVMGYSSVSLFNLDTGRPVGQLKTPSPAWVYSMAFIGKGGRMLCGRLHDSKALFWNVRDGHICEGAAPFYRQGVFAVSPDKRTVAYAEGGRIRLGDCSTGSELPVSAKMPRCASVIEMMALQGDAGAETLTTASERGLWRWDVKTASDRAMLARPKEWRGKWIALSGDGKLAASLDSGGLVGVHDVAGGERVALIEPGAGKIASAAFSDDGRVLVTASCDSINLWNMPSGTLKKAIKLPEKKYLSITKLVLSSDGARVAAVASRPNPAVRNADPRAKQMRSMVIPPELFGIEIFNVAAGKACGRIDGLLFALSPDSRTLAKPGYKCIELWDIAEMKKTGTLECSPGLLSGFMGAPPVRLRFSPDGRMLARSFIADDRAGGRAPRANGCVQLYDLAVGRSRVFKVGDVESTPLAIFSKDSRKLVTAGACGGILLWDISKPFKPVDTP
jgi:WD40 repeat protein